MKNRLFIVFSFNSAIIMKRFKRTKDMRLVAEKKLAEMEEGKSYTEADVVDLFDDPYPCYLIYELTESVDELEDKKNLCSEDAS